MAADPPSDAERDDELARILDQHGEAREEQREQAAANITDTARCLALFWTTLVGCGVEDDAATHLAEAWMYRMVDDGGEHA